MAVLNQYIGRIQFWGNMVVSIDDGEVLEGYIISVKSICTVGVECCSLR
jgi:hypothetical protein